jgi:hypothetical protein
MIKLSYIVVDEYYINKIKVQYEKKNTSFKKS